MEVRKIGKKVAEIPIYLNSSTVKVAFTGPIRRTKVTEVKIGKRTIKLVEVLPI